MKRLRERGPALNPHIKLSAEQKEFVERRAGAFADNFGLRRFSLVHILCEAYMQGMSDAVEVASAPHQPVIREGE